jgi:hypothetical protein
MDARTTFLLGSAAWLLLACSDDGSVVTAGAGDPTSVGGSGAAGGAEGGMGGAEGGAAGEGGSGGAGAAGGAGGMGQPPLFHSDWSTALGSSEEAVSDGGRWTIVGGQGGEIIPSTGLDFPTANVLQVPWSDGWSLPRTTGMPIPAVGESRFYRWYFQVTVPDDVEDGQTHPIQDGNAGSQINWELAIRHNDAGPGMFVPQFVVHTNNGWPNYMWIAPGLQKHVTYRYELHLVRTGETTFQIHPRIYDSGGALLFDDDDFATPTNSATLASSPELLFNDVNNLDGLNSGCNGGEMPEPGLYGYQGGFCVRADTWCGPYEDGI